MWDRKPEGWSPAVVAWERVDGFRCSPSPGVKWERDARSVSCRSPPRAASSSMVNPALAVLEHPFQHSAYVRRQGRGRPELGGRRWRCGGVTRARRVTMFLAANDRSPLAGKLAVEGLTPPSPRRGAAVRGGRPRPVASRPHRAEGGRPAGGGSGVHRSRHSRYRYRMSTWQTLPLAPATHFRPSQQAEAPPQA